MLTIASDRGDEIGNQVEPSFKCNVNRTPGLLDPVLIFDKFVVGTNQPDSRSDADEYNGDDNLWGHGLFLVNLNELNI